MVSPSAAISDFPNLPRNRWTWLGSAPRLSGTFSGTFFGTLLNLTWPCTKAARTFSDPSSHQSLPGLLLNLLRKPFNLTCFCTKASQTFSGTFSATLLNLTSLCTKASQSFSEPDPAPAPVRTGAFLGWQLVGEDDGSDTVLRSRRKTLYTMSKVTGTWTYCSSFNHQTLHYTTLSYTRYYAALTIARNTSLTTAMAKNKYIEPHYI